MKKSFLIAFIVLILLGVFFVVLYYQKTGLKIENKKNIILSVDLEIKPPFSRANLNISGWDYKISYTAKGGTNNLISEADSKYITKAQFQELTDLINDGFWSLADKYEDKNFLDATYYTVTISSCGDHVCGVTDDPSIYKKVTCYGQCPAAVDEIINKVKELWGTKILEVGV